jgi:hypothetical protein
MIVHLVDGTYELFRHFHGLRRFRVKGSLHAVSSFYPWCVLFEILLVGRGLPFCVRLKPQNVAGWCEESMKAEG